MRKLSVLGLALVSMFALFAIAASSAFAESEWLVENVAPTVELPAYTEGTLTLENEANNAKIECLGIFEGKIGPTNKDLVTDILNTSEEVIGGLGDTNTLFTDCTIRQSTIFCGNAGTLAEVWPENLNLELNTTWETEILLEGTTFLDDFPVASGYEVKCPTGIEVKCTGVASAILTNGTNDVLGEFTRANTETTCSNNTKGWLVGKGLTTAVETAPLTTPLTTQVS